MGFFLMNVAGFIVAWFFLIYQYCKRFGVEKRNTYINVTYEIDMSALRL